MKDENIPNSSIAEPRISKLKKRRRPISNAGSSDRQKLGTILDASVASLKQPASAANDGSDTIQKAAPTANGQTSVFDFINHMSQTELQSVISSIVGDLRWSGFEEAVSQSFDYRENNTKKVGRSNEHYGKVFYHPLLGKIDLSSSAAQTGGEKESMSIAFPESTKKEVDDEGVASLFPFDKVHKQLGNGLRIPISYCQFPNKGQMAAAPKQSCRTLDSDTIQAAAEQQQSDTLIDEDFEIIEQESNHKANAAASPAFKYAERKQQSSQSIGIDSNSTKNTCQQTKYKGKILIHAPIGASIREVFDIDKSNHVLGKLQQGDVRYFLKKKELPPPPPNSEDYDDDCVAVTRYKIVLEEGDCASSEFAKRDGGGRLVGWISDRSRLVDEPYMILKEV